MVLLVLCPCSFFFFLQLQAVEAGEENGGGQEDRLREAANEMQAAISGLRRYTAAGSGEGQQTSEDRRL